MGFVDELQRRNVFRVAAAYVVTSWLLIQVAETLFPLFGYDDTPARLVVITLAIGFIPALVLAWVYELTAEGLKKEKDIDRSQSITKHTGKKLDRAIMVVLAIGLAYFAVDKFILDPARDAEREVSIAEQARSDALVESYGDKSIAVLPFVNMSSDPEQEYFSDGISEEILNLLAKIPQLRVAARTSAFSFKGKDVTIAEIGKVLNVAHVLEGSVRKSGNKVRITTQLIDAVTDTHLWSETYDRELADIFAIQDEIAGVILGQLKVHLLGDDQPVLASTRTNSEAYNLYLAGKQRIYERSGPSMQAAIELLSSAIESDPDYAPAYAQRAIAYMLSPEYGTMPPEEEKTARQLGRQDADKALALDSDLAEAWSAVGFSQFTPAKDDREKAIEALDNALAINPSLINARLWLRNIYRSLGEYAKAAALLESINELDPLFKPGIYNLIGDYNDQGRQNESLALLERVGPYLPDDPLMLEAKVVTLFSLGHDIKGQQLLEEARRKHPGEGIWEPIVVNRLLHTHQWERLAASKSGFRIVGLVSLGRLEEAEEFAQEIYDVHGTIVLLLGLDYLLDRPADLIEQLEKNYADLDAFEADFLGNPFAMPWVAYAYQATGNKERSADILARIRVILDRQIKGGIDNRNFDWSEAIYYALAGDHDTAIARLDAAVSRGYIGPLPITKGEPALKVLEGDPRFQAIQARMMENLNALRADLGLEPADT